MSGRKLGGGRVLGSGKGLAKPLPSPAAPVLPPGSGIPRASSPLAPSECSTLSFGSPNSISPPASNGPLPGFSPQDLTSNISLGGPSGGAGGGGGGGAGGGRLVCPICEEEMVTLLQLNRHLDDSHQELPEVQQDEVKTWFDKQVLKAKRFQPLSLINQKLRGLETFESNESLPFGPASHATVVAHASSVGVNGAGQGGPRYPEPVIDPDELVTRTHWQKPTGSDLCTDPACGTRLGPLSGSINCRSCGRLFCEEHTMYQMKLSRSAKHEPVRGYWCRVCETCYKSREGYNDHAGLLVDHTADFAATRRNKVERQNLEIARLEKRLTKLTRLLADPREDFLAAAAGVGAGAGAGAGAGGGGGGASALLNSTMASFSGQSSPRKLLEQSVVTWEDDNSVSKCPFCQQEFGSWTFRRHHCRICGRVVCADPQTGCSSEVGLSVAGPTRAAAEKPSSARPVTNGAGTGSANSIGIDIRMCRDCRTTIFAKRDFAASITHKPPDQRAYETLRQFERGIRQLMPSFQRALLLLQPPEDDRLDGSGASSKRPPAHAQIQEAAKIRKRLTDSFTKYHAAARRLRDLKTSSPAQLRLQKAVYAAASSFLHANMLPLKSLPKLLKSQSSSSGHSPAGPSNHRRLLSLTDRTGSGGSMSPLRNGESAGSPDGGDTASIAGSEASTVVSAALESEEKELRERLVVLEEQRFLVREMVSSARGSRRFEEVSALSRNLDELDREIETLKKQIGGVEERWEGFYAANGGAGR